MINSGLGAMAASRHPIPSHYRHYRAQDLIHIDIDLGSVLLPFLQFLAEFLGCCQPSLPNSALVIFLSVRVQSTILASFVIAVWYSTKVCIRVDACKHFATDVTHLGAASTYHFVAAITFDKRCLAFRTLSNFCFCHGFFYLESTFIFSFLLNYFIASKRNVRFFPTFSTRFIPTVLHRTLKDNEIEREIGLESTLGARAATNNESG